MISGTKMTIFDFLVPKIENFGFKNPYKHVPGHFGRGRNFRHFSAFFERGGVGIFGITQNFGKEFFCWTCNFSENANFQKKIFSAGVWPIISVRNWICNYWIRNFGDIAAEKKRFLKNRVFFIQSPNGPYATDAERGFFFFPTTSYFDRIKSLKAF